MPISDGKVPTGEFPASAKVSPVEVLHSMKNSSLSCLPGSKQTSCLSPASSLAEGAEFEMVSADHGELEESAVPVSGEDIQCAELDSTTEGENIACLYRAQHLANYNWRDCTQCRAFLRH
jgi:hypothetical protein